MCAPVIQTQLTRLTEKPCKKCLSERLRAISTAHATKITTQKRGSMLDGITKTVATPMARPNRDSCKINLRSRVFMCASPLQDRAVFERECRLGFRKRGFAMS